MNLPAPHSSPAPPAASAAPSPPRWPPAAGTLVVDARDADRLAARRRRPAAPRPVTASPGDVADPAHRDGWPPPSGRPARPAREQRQRPRPEPAAARSPTYPLGALRAGPRGQHARPARADPAAAADAARRRGGRGQHISSDAAVEAYAAGAATARQGRARPARPRCSPSRSPDLRVYAVDPGDMAHRHAPGRVPRARTSATGPRRRRVVPALLRPGRRRPAERPLPRRRRWPPAGAAGVTGDRFTAARPASRPPHRRRRAGWPATRCGCWSPAPGGVDAPPRSATCPTCSSPATSLVVNTSATAARRGRRRAARDGARAPVHVSDRRSTTAAGWSSCAVRTTPARTCGAEPGDGARLPGGVRLQLLAAYPDPRRPPGCGGRGTAPARVAARRTSPGTAGRSATATCAGDVAAGRPTRTCSPREPGQRRDGQRRPAVHRPSCWSRLMAARGRGRAARRCTPASSSPELHEPPPPERFAVPDGHRAARQRHPARRAAGSSRSAPPSPGPWSRPPTRTACPRRRRAGPTWCSAPTARPGW